MAAVKDVAKKLTSWKEKTGQTLLTVKTTEVCSGFFFWLPENFIYTSFDLEL